MNGTVVDGGRWQEPVLVVVIAMIVGVGTEPRWRGCYRGATGTPHRTGSEDQQPLEAKKAQA